jgi:hypothetical protein
MPSPRGGGAARILDTVRREWPKYRSAAGAAVNVLLRREDGG